MWGNAAVNLICIVLRGISQIAFRINQLVLRMRGLSLPLVHEPAAAEHLSDLLCRRPPMVSQVRAHHLIRVIWKKRRVFLPDAASLLSFDPVPAIEAPLFFHRVQLS